MEKRVERKVYENQEKIKEEIISHLKRIIFREPFTKRVYLLGSLVGGQFGVYTKPKIDKIGEISYGSDVDLIIIADERFKIPSNWKKKDDFIFEYFEFGELKDVSNIKEKIHRINVFIYRKSLENLSVANKNKLFGDVFTCNSRKEALAFWLNNHPNEIIFDKEMQPDFHHYPK